MLILLMIVCALFLGCGRSADNGKGFDQAVQDMDRGVTPTRQMPSGEYRRGYREAVDKVQSGVRQQEQYSTDRMRAQQLHERIPGKK